MVDVAGYLGRMYVCLHEGPLPPRVLDATGYTSAYLKVQTDALSDADVAARLACVNLGDAQSWDVCAGSVRYMPVVLRHAAQHGMYVHASSSAAVRAIVACAPMWTNADWRIAIDVMKSTLVGLNHALEAACASSRIPGVLNGIVFDVGTALAPRGMFTDAVHWDDLHAAVLRGDVVLVDTRVALPNHDELIVTRARGATTAALWISIWRAASLHRDYWMTVHRKHLFAAGVAIEIGDHTLEEHAVDDETCISLVG